MKKTLASCLSTLALLSSMGFSSPTQEVHATEPEEVTTTVDLKVKILSNYLNIWKTKSNVQIENAKFKIVNIPEGYEINKIGSGVQKVEGEEDTYQFTSKELSSMIYYKKNPGTEYETAYGIIWSTYRKTLEELPPDLTIDFSKFKNDDNTTFNKYSGLFVDKTAQTVQGKLGETIDLKFPASDNIKFSDIKASNFKSNNKNIDAENLIKWSSETLNGSLSGKITEDVEPGTKLTFDLSFIAKDLDHFSYNPVTTVTRDTYPFTEELFAYPKHFTMPVELTLGEKLDPDPTPDSKDENINNKEDEIKDEINSEKEPSSSEDEAPVDKEENDNEESSTAVKTGDNSLYAIIFAAFAAIIAKVLISLCSKKTVKK